jgi:hypothetical protein
MLARNTTEEDIKELNLMASDKDMAHSIIVKVDDI